MPPLNLNLGCGSNRLTGYINIDIEESCHPDLVHDFTKGPLPYDDNTVDNIVLFHTIEHIQKRFHVAILNEIWRVLRPNGTFIISFPEFSRCVENWKTNKNGQKEFWEATIFGRQLYPSDHHVCIIDSHDMAVTLVAIGFKIASVRPEPVEDYNSFIACSKRERVVMNPTDILANEMSRYEIKTV